LRALDLTAQVLARLVESLVVVERPEEFKPVWCESLVPVLAPRWFMETIDAISDDSLPETWETTSDSIAARLADHLGASLVLLKSASPGAVRDRAELSRTGFLDPAFPRVSRRLERVTVVNLKDEPWSGYVLSNSLLEESLRTNSWTMLPIKESK
jgi:aspartokinase-like uncharacterized kinase